MDKVHDRLNKQRNIDRQQEPFWRLMNPPQACFQLRFILNPIYRKKTADAMPDEDDWAEQKLSKSNYSLGGKSSVSSSSRAKILCFTCFCDETEGEK